MSVNAADPASKVIYVFVETAELDAAIKDRQFIPVRADGSQMLTQEFQGGIIIDGAPINVWMGDGWFQGQKEVLQPYWDDGSVPLPPAELLNLPVGPMPTDVALGYQAYLESQGEPTPAWLEEQLPSPGDVGVPAFLEDIPIPWLIGGAVVMLFVIPRIFGGRR